MAGYIGISYNSDISHPGDIGIVTKSDMSQASKKRYSKEKIGGSIQDTSIVRKFTILFLLMSVIPTVVLYYFYEQIKEYGRIQLTTNEFNVTLIFIVLGVIVGYASMRDVLNQLFHMI